MKPSEILFNQSIANKKKFGVYIRTRRNELGLSLRNLAKQLNLSTAYISDIENGNRTAPLNNLKQIASLLLIEKSELDYFYDIAGCTHSNWPDINEYLTKIPSARKAIRLAKEKNISGEEFLEIVLKIKKYKESEESKSFS